MSGSGWGAGGGSTDAWWTQSTTPAAGGTSATLSQLQASKQGNSPGTPAPNATAGAAAKKGLSAGAQPFTPTAPAAAAAPSDSDDDSCSADAQAQLVAALGVGHESSGELLWADVIKRFAATATQAGDAESAAAVAALVEPDMAALLEEFGGLAKMLRDEEAATATAAGVRPGGDTPSTSSKSEPPAASARPTPQHQQQQEDKQRLFLMQQEALLAEFEAAKARKDRAAGVTPGTNSSSTDSGWTVVAPRNAPAGPQQQQLAPGSGLYAFLEDDEVHPTDWQFEDCYDSCPQGGYQGLTGAEGWWAAGPTAPGGGASPWQHQQQEEEVGGTCSGGGWQTPLKLRLQRMELIRWRAKQQQVQQEREAARLQAALRQKKALQLNDAEEFPSLAALPRSPAPMGTSYHQGGSPAGVGWQNPKDTKGKGKGGASGVKVVRVAKDSWGGVQTAGWEAGEQLVPTAEDLHMELLLEGLTPLHPQQASRSEEARHAARTLQLAAAQEAISSSSTTNATHSSSANPNHNSTRPGKPGKGPPGNSSGSGRDGASQEVLLSMMTKAARKQPGPPSSNCSGPEASLYRWLAAKQEEGSGAKRYGYNWAQLFESMQDGGWVPQMGLAAGGKHFKFRRVCPASQRTQVLTMPCTPSDVLRSVRSAAASVARRDEEALAWEADALGLA